VRLHVSGTAVVRGLVHTCLASVLAFLFLLPRIPPPPRPWCKFETVRVGRWLNYRLDFDSPVFLDIAYEPAFLFIDHGEWHTRQSRPLYPLLASALTPVASRIPGLRDMNIHPAYPAFALINLATLVAALGFFTSLVGSSPRAWALGTLVGVLLFSNDVAKVYTWTPHQQLFNILEPLACAWLLRHVACRPKISAARAGMYGLAAGTALLAYGSFSLLLPAMLIGIAARTRDGEPVARVAAACVLGVAGFVFPLSAWVAFMHRRAGGFYVGEVGACRDFVWMVDAWRRGGAPGFARRFAINSAYFFGTFTHERIIPLFVGATALTLCSTAWHRTGVAIRNCRATLLACAVAVALNFFFFWFIGNPCFGYGPRLTFTVLPALLAGAAAVLAAVLEDVPARTWRIVVLLLAAFVAAAHGYVVSQVGPSC
jgi:hypothetical protein